MIKGMKNDRKQCRIAGILNGTLWDDTGYNPCVGIAKGKVPEVKGIVDLEKQCSPNIEVGVGEQASSTRNFNTCIKGGGR